MINYLTTNIFTSPAQALINTVNTVGVMGKGVALEFKKLYPIMYKQYRQRCKSGWMKIGKLFIYRTPHKIIVNFPTKRHWRASSKVEYLEVGLQEFVKQYNTYGITSASFPQIGCGNGELDWDKQVKPLMEHYLKALPIPVYIHLYPKAPDFIPERLDPTYVQELQLEREIIPFAQVWQDLRSLILSQAEKGCHAPELSMTDVAITFQFQPESTKVIYRQDIEDLWNTLRLSGTVDQNRVPEPIRADGMIGQIFDLLVRLPYVGSIELYSPNQIDSSRGLQYCPPARLFIQSEEELMV